jgi:hypothetical protein
MGSYATFAPWFQQLQQSNEPPIIMVRIIWGGVDSLLTGAPSTAGMLSWCRCRHRHRHLVVLLCVVFINLIQTHPPKAHKYIDS